MPSHVEIANTFSYNIVCETNCTSLSVSHFCSVLCLRDNCDATFPHSTLFLSFLIIPRGILKKKNTETFRFFLLVDSHANWHSPSVIFLCAFEFFGVNGIIPNEWQRDIWKRWGDTSSSFRHSFFSLSPCVWVWKSAGNEWQLHCWIHFSTS